MDAELLALELRQARLREAHAVFLELASVLEQLESGDLRTVLIPLRQALETAFAVPAGVAVVGEGLRHGPPLRFITAQAETLRLERRHLDLSAPAAAHADETSDGDPDSDNKNEPCLR